MHIVSFAGWSGSSSNSKSLSMEYMFVHVIHLNVMCLSQVIVVCCPVLWLGQHACTHNKALHSKNILHYWLKQEMHACRYIEHYSIHKAKYLLVYTKLPCSISPSPYTIVYILGYLCYSPLVWCFSFSRTVEDKVWEIYMYIVCAIFTTLCSLVSQIVDGYNRVVLSSHQYTLAQGLSWRIFQLE